MKINPEIDAQQMSQRLAGHLGDNLDLEAEDCFDQETINHGVARIMIYLANEISLVIHQGVSFEPEK